MKNFVRTFMMPPLFPAHCQRQNGGMLVQLNYVPPQEFVDPFSDWTVERTSAPRYDMLLTNEMIEELSFSFRKPAGIIFHTARCGSTLAAQLLKEINSITVYSEPMALNDLLMPPVIHDLGVVIRDIRAIGALLSKHARGPYIIKLRSWNTLFCRTMLEALQCPWIFCTRDLIEVAASVETKPPTWLRAFGRDDNPFLSFIEAADISSREDYIARIIAAFHNAIISLGKHNGAIVEYQELPNSAWEKVPSHLGLSVTSNITARMAEAARFYSKGRRGNEIVFCDDRRSKRTSASLALKAAIEQHANPAREAMLRAWGLKENTYGSNN